MILYFINALAFGFCATCYRRTGWLDVFSGLTMALLAVVNGSLAAPLLLRWLE